MVWRNTLGSTSSGGRKLSGISIAWQNIANWLTDIAVAAGALATPHRAAAASRATWLLLSSRWDKPGDSVHAEAVRHWFAGLSLHILGDRQIVVWLRATAVAIAKRTAAHDRAKSDAAWRSWMQEGPAKNVGKMHRMSRVQNGWIPSPLAKESSDSPGAQPDSHYSAIINCRGR